MAATPDPVPTYAEVSISKTDAKTGETRSQFNPVWLSWFLRLNRKAFQSIDLTSQVEGILPQPNGGTGVDISAYPSGTVPLGPLTIGGTTGSLTVVEGLISAYVAPT